MAHTQTLNRLSSAILCILADVGAVALCVCGVFDPKVQGQSCMHCLWLLLSEPKWFYYRAHLHTCTRVYTHRIAFLCIFFSFIEVK